MPEQRMAQPLQGTPAQLEPMNHVWKSRLVVNRGTKAVPTEFVLPQGYRMESVECLWAPDRLSRTTLAKSDIQMEQQTAAGASAITLRPVSVTRVYLRRG
jgi:hypothetical protein